MWAEIIRNHSFGLSYQRKVILAVVCSAWFMRRVMRPSLLPYGPAAQLDAPSTYSNVDFDNDSLRLKHGGKLQKLVEQASDDPRMKGPETVVFDPEGNMYILSYDSKLVQLSNFHTEDDDTTIVAETKVVAGLGVGRPLGGKFDDNGFLYMANPVTGLCRIQVRDEHPKVELLASRVWDEDHWSPILFADDVTVGPKTGNIYFTDATDIPPIRHGPNSWDVLHPSKLDLGRGRRTGRLLQYNPQTREVTILARNLWFANGISLTANEESIVMAETFGQRLLQYHMESQQLEVLVDELPGHPDGVDCDTTHCYAVLPTPVVKIVQFIWSIPAPIDRLLRTMIMMLPRSLAPAPETYGGIVQVDLTTKESKILQDPTGSDIAHLYGVTVHDGKLYLGSLKNDYVGVYTL